MNLFTDSTLPVAHVATVVAGLHAWLPGQPVTIGEYPFPRGFGNVSKVLYAVSHAPKRGPTIFLTSAVLSSEQAPQKTGRLRGLATNDLIFATTDLPPYFGEQAPVLLWLTVLHELGHMLGADHCGTWGCVMATATDHKALLARKEEFCEVCKGHIRRAVDYKTAMATNLRDIRGL